MNFKKIMCVLSSMFIISGPSFLANNAEATTHLLKFKKDFHIESSKSNCGWVSSSVNFLRYCIENKRKSNVKVDKLKEDFIKECDEDAYKNNKTENIFRVIWSVRRILEKYLKGYISIPSKFEIEHYIKSFEHDVWCYISHSSNDKTYEPKKGNGIKEGLNELEEFNPQAIFKEYILENKVPLICGVDLRDIFNINVPFPMFQSAIIVGCETDINNKITHIIFHTLVPGTKIFKFDINDFFDFCCSISGIRGISIVKK